MQQVKQTITQIVMTKKLVNIEIAQLDNRVNRIVTGRLVDQKSDSTVRPSHSYNLCIV